MLIINEIFETKLMILLIIINFIRGTIQNIWTIDPISHFEDMRLTFHK